MSKAKMNANDYFKQRLYNLISEYELYCKAFDEARTWDGFIVYCEMNGFINPEAQL